MKPFFLLAALLFTSCSVLHAASTPAPASRAKLFDPATISQKALPNGVRSVIQEAPGTDLVTVQVWVRAGSRYETSQNNGVTHVIETVAMRSSKAYPESGGDNAGGPRAAIQALGGEGGSLTSRDSVFFSATVAAPFLPSAMRILADAVLRPDLTDARVEAAKQEILTELLVATSDPLRQATDLAYYTSFQKHPYRLMPQGSPNGLATLTGSIVRAYHTARFAGSNISVVVAGDVARETGHALVAQHFGAVAKAAAPTEVNEEAPPTMVLPSSRRGTLPVSTVALAWRSAPISEPQNVIAMDILLAHWKEGRDAKLGRILRAVPLGGNEDEEALQADETEEGEQEGDNEDVPAPSTPKENTDPENVLPLALGFNVDYLTQHDSGLFIITLVAPRERNETIGEIIEEVNLVRNEGLTEAELNRAKFLLTQQYLEQSESVSGLAGALGFYEMIESYQFAVNYLERIARVSNDDIKRMAQKYLTPEAYVQATIEGRTDLRPPSDGGTLQARRDY